MRSAASAFCLVVLLACGSNAIAPSSPSSTTAEAHLLLGDWQWTRSCEAVVEAFDEAGLSDRLRRALVDARYFANEEQVQRDDPCAGAEETPYLYFFESPGRWGVIDDDDVLVEDRRFTIVDDDTIAFDAIQIDARIDGDSLTFEVRRPETCDSACLDDYVWSLATFAPATLDRVA